MCLLKLLFMVMALKSGKVHLLNVALVVYDIIVKTCKLYQTKSKMILAGV